MLVDYMQLWKTQTYSERLVVFAYGTDKYTYMVNVMCIGPCIIVIVEAKETNFISLVIKFYFTSILNMFRTLIHSSSGACDFSVVSPHWSCVLVSMCVGVSVWLGWGGIRVSGFSLLC